VTVHNLAREGSTVTFDLPDEADRPLEDLLDDGRRQEVEGARHRLELEGYGFRWLRVSGSPHQAERASPAG
jgi:maltose alpha-D-glucosyltransferase/alpha-amylase